MRQFNLIHQEPGGIRTELVNYDESTGDWTVAGAIPDDPTHAAEVVNISKKDYASNDTNVSIDETYNQLLLTCELDELETLVESPTDDEAAYSPYYNKQKYCTEYAASGDGSTSWNEFKNMLANGTSSWDGASIIHHYVQIFKSNVWRFNGDRYIRDDHTGQLEVLKAAKQNTCTAFLAEFGSTKPKNAMDNSIQKAPSMSRYLVISVNGNGKDEDGQYAPTENQLQAAIPLAEYTGNIAGGFFSPSDDETTNYIIISGKMIATSQRQHNTTCRLLPEQELSIRQLRQIIQESSLSFIERAFFDTIDLDNDNQGNGFYYAVEFMDAPTDKSDPTPRQNDTLSLFPYNSDWKSLTELKYGYSANGDETDRINKLPLIQITLKVGEKYACEMFDAEGNSYYEWHTLDDCPYDTYNGERQPRNHIYIGANIAIDDFIIGKEYEIANSVQPDWNIDAEGIAIPVKKSDGISGKVELTIDGVCNDTFDEITRRHPSFWRSTKWYHNVKRIVAHINQIMIKDFTVEIYSDNNLINNITGDNDLVYKTEELTDYVEKKDDIEFVISTALTTEECVEKGITNKILRNNPYIGESPLRNIHNKVTNFTGKAEEQYLNDYWPMYSSPKQKIETTIHMPQNASWTSIFKVPNQFNYNYYPMSFNENLRLDRTTVTLRQT